MKAFKTTECQSSGPQTNSKQASKNLIRVVLPPHIRPFTATSCGSGDETIATPVHTQIGNTAQIDVDRRIFSYAKSTYFSLELKCYL